MYIYVLFQEEFTNYEANDPWVQSSIVTLDTMLTTFKVSCLCGHSWLFLCVCVCVCLRACVCACLHESRYILKLDLEERKFIRLTFTTSYLRKTDPQHTDHAVQSFCSAERLFLAKWEFARGLRHSAAQSGTSSSWRACRKILMGSLRHVYISLSLIHISEPTRRA